MHDAIDHITGPKFSGHHSIRDIICRGISSFNNDMKEDEELPLPSDWRKAETDDGQTYYYHSITRERSWNHPLQQQQHQQTMDMSLDPNINDATDIFHPRLHRTDVLRQLHDMSNILDHSQAEAIVAALQKRVALVQGPPGTVCGHAIDLIVGVM